MASGKNTKSIKNNPELFSEEAQTTSERILEQLAQEKQPIENFPERSYFQPEDNTPQAPIASAQERLTDLLDKYCNGDRDVEYAQRFSNKEAYKQELISVLKQCGITYVKKQHYPLSKDELHIIRMDYFGRIRQPDFEKLGTLYKAYLNPVEKRPQPYIKESPFHKKKKKKNTIIPLDAERQSYPLDDYRKALKNSPAWNIYYLFPRFHNLEYRMLTTIQAMHIPPEKIPMLNVYDFSDVLYRTFRESDKSRDAHLFLGAKQAFIKDVFRKQESWIRNYLKRQNIHPRYIDALIKSAQSKGITNDIQIASDAHTFMSEYATAYAEDFQNFIIHSIKSDNYANAIRERIQNNAYTIEGSALNFLENTKEELLQFIKKSLSETAYISALYEQFSHQTPAYVLDDIRSFLKTNPQHFAHYIQKLDIAPSLQRNIIKNLPDFNNSEQWSITKAFVLNNQDDFFVYLLDNSRSTNYARFALESISDTPHLTDFGKDIINSFLLAETENPATHLTAQQINSIKTNGLTNETLQTLTPFIRHHFSALQNYFKENNVLTFTELQNELIENNLLLLQNNGIPESMHSLHKDFILSNIDYFKDWYIHFHTQSYKEKATNSYEKLVQEGLDNNNAGYCCDFIKQRLSNFIEFAGQYNLKSSEIIHNLNEHSLLQNETLSGAIHHFIIRHNSAFKNFLLQDHLKQKESNFVLMINKMKQQGVSEQNEGLIHKFILDNIPLYKEYLRQNKQISQQAEQIYEKIITNKPSAWEKAILNNYLNQNIYNYMIFQQDNNQLIPYVKNIVQNVKHTQIGSTEEHWLKTYSAATQKQFQGFLTDKHYLDKEKSEDFVKNIKFTKKNMIVTFNDGSVIKIALTVHHKEAIQDSGEIKSGNRYLIPPTTTQLAEKVKQLLIAQEQKLRKASPLELTELENGNIAQINDFSNLCIFPEWWHRLMHSMDRTESFENRERYVARLMPTNPNIIFFGSEKPEDQLCYDYANDQRTKSYKHRLDALITQSKTFDR